MEAQEIKKILSEVLPPERLSQSPEDVAGFRPENPLLSSSSAARAVVRPRDVGELQALVRLARERQLPLVPVSSRGPHRKSGLVCEKPHVIVDLSSWKKIDGVDRRNRVCRIQPGVTYAELDQALAPLGLTVSMPLAPRAGKSVLAAVMDREPSTCPNKQWDIADPVGSTEIIFGNGDLFRTGAAGGPGSLEKQRAAGGAQKSPMGPSQTDFHRVVQGAQGWMGIVTWITIRTELRPSLQEPWMLGSHQLEPLANFVYEVQRAMLGEQTFLLNATGLALLLCQGQSERFTTLRESLPAFICFQNLAGFERLPQERVNYQREELRELAAKSGLVLREQIGEVSAGEVLTVATRPSGEHDFRDLLLGNCLSIFFLTTLDRAAGFISIFEEVCKESDQSLEQVGIYLQPVVQNHFCHLEFMIPFDPRRRESVERMKELEAKAIPRLFDHGAFFSRPYGLAEKMVWASREVQRELLQKIKAIFDPARILNPGKFGL